MMRKWAVVFIDGEGMVTMTTEIANNENNVILKLDNGTIAEWTFAEIDGKFYGVMAELRYLSPHSGGLIETGRIIKTIELGDTREEGRKYWDSLIRHKR